MPAYFKQAFLVKAFAWIESFRASWLANYPDPEDVDDRAITLLWGPVLLLVHGDEDPIDLGCDMPVPRTFSRALFPFDIHPGDPGHPSTPRGG